MNQELNELMRQLRKVIQFVLPQLEPKQQAQVPLMFNPWKTGIGYKVGDIVRYEEGKVLYKCLQEHVSQETWTPTDAPSLWVKVLTDIEGGTILPWQQPDSTNPYQIGDKVTHNGKTWECTVANNVWEPGVYGWTEVVG